MMRSSLFLASLVFAVTANEQLEEPKPKLLEEVFGDAKQFAETHQAPKRTSKDVIKRTSEYYSRRTPENCNFALDVVIVQDSTGSFADDYAIMRETQLKLMTDALSATHPGTRFGLVSFKDKPIRTLGETFDYCQRYDLPLTETGFTGLFDAYGKLWSNGGQDPAENQFGATIAALQSQQVGWNNTEDVTRLIVMSTDAWPHFNDDGLNKYGMSEYSGHLEQDEAAQCLKEYYPSPVQVRDALANANAYSAYLIFDGNYANGLVKDSWEWFNTFIGQPSTFVEPLANDSSNFWTVLSSVLTAIEESECVQTSTAAPTTTSAALTTTASTTYTTLAATTTTATTAATSTTYTTPVATTTTSTTTVSKTYTTPAATTMTTTTPKATTSLVTTVEPTVTPVASTESTPAESTGVECSEGNCQQCACGKCPCPEVLIKLLHRPSQLHLDVSNE